MSEETEKLIEEADRLSECASPGPWRRGSVHAAEEVWAAYPESIAGLAGERLLLRLNPNFTSEHDTGFIARARTMVPELAAALRRAETERDEALKQSAGWASEARVLRDLRDRLVRAEAERDAEAYKRQTQEVSAKAIELTKEVCAKLEKAEAERDAQHAEVLRLTGERDAAREALAQKHLRERLSVRYVLDRRDARIAELTATRDLLTAENARLQQEHNAYCRKLANDGLTVAGRLQRELDAVRAENDTLHYLLRGGQ